MTTYTNAFETGIVPRTRLCSDQSKCHKCVCIIPLSYLP